MRKLAQGKPKLSVAISFVTESAEKRQARLEKMQQILFDGAYDAISKMNKKTIETNLEID